MRVDLTPDWINRFWSKVDRSGGPDACWPWTGVRGPLGYGRIHSPRPNRRNLHAHRIAWTMTRGEIPDGLCVCHSCDNPSCCNPAHLWLGTNAENTADRHRKGRSARGGRVGVVNSRARLNEDKVREIRFRVARGESQKAVAASLGVTDGMVNHVVHRRAWRHVE